MSKYDPLRQFLENCQTDSWTATFSNIEDVLGFPLPESAHTYQAWWANQSGHGHSQTGAWRDAGYATRDLDLKRRRVRFERVTSQPDHPIDDLANLWSSAASLTGIDDRERLTEMALTALIQRQAAQSLARLGGTMPAFQAPPRERPTE